MSRRGVVFAIAGAALAAIAFLMLDAGLDIKGVGAFVVVVAPAMVTVGIAMVIAPGADTGDHDLAEWLERMPLRRRLVFYACGALGLAIGVVLVLVLADWSLEGLLRVVF
jgi:hypothetical protein